jgi:guanylate kinase
MNLIEEFVDDIISVFIEPPGINVQEQIESLNERLTSRGDYSETLIKQRLKRFELELSYKEKFNFSFINEDLKDTTKQIDKIIKENLNESRTSSI